MKTAKNAEFYNDLYQRGGHKGEYLKKPEDSVYYPAWQAIVGRLKDSDVIMELGCGAGQLAKLIIGQGFLYNAGIDFSEKAVAMASRNNPSAYFYVGDIYDPCQCCMSQANTVIMTEVLEHLDDDLGALRLIPKGWKVLFSVPNFDSASHVRYFRDIESVLERYGDYLKLEWIDSIRINASRFIWVFEGYRI